MVLELFNKETRFQPGQRVYGYTIQKNVGEGRFGICYLVSKDQKQYILKHLKRKVLRKNRLKAGYEAEILNKINHQNIPRFIKQIKDKNFDGYLLEFKPGKTFEEVIFEEHQIFAKHDIYNVGRQLINIMKYLHSNGVVHRDIRVPNTLYHQGHVYLVDFGLARLINEERYSVDVDFSYLGDFLLHLYYTSYEIKGKSRPWYEELSLNNAEMMFLKRLVGIEKNFTDIAEVESEFSRICF